MKTWPFQPGQRCGIGVPCSKAKQRTGTEVALSCGKATAKQWWTILWIEGTKCFCISDGIRTWPITISTSSLLATSFCILKITSLGISFFHLFCVSDYFAHHLRVSDFCSSSRSRGLRESGGEESDENGSLNQFEDRMYGFRKVTRNLPRIAR